jgi:hypothetical protein
MLFPESLGNPNRTYINHTKGTLDEKNLQEIGTQQFTFLTWIQNPSALFHAWPKVRARNGVHAFHGSTMRHNIQPISRVPILGNTRMMSKQQEEYHVAISQQGIGSFIEGGAVDHEAGAQILNNEYAAFAESATLGMAYNTAINMVNAAHQNCLNQRSQASFAENYAQLLSRDLQMYAILGLNPDGLAAALDELHREHPEFDTLFLPDGCEPYLAARNPRTIEVKLYAHTGFSFVEADPKQSFVTLSTLRGLDILEMPLIKIDTQKRAIQALEADVAIGEFYAPTTKTRRGNIGRHGLKQDDIIIYDQPNDNYARLSARDHLANLQIWDKRTGTYSDSLKAYTENLNRDKDRFLLPEERHESMLTVPIRFDPKKTYEGKQYILPNVIGQMNEAHFDSDLLEEITESALHALTASKPMKHFFQNAFGQMNVVDALRSAIEDLPYDAASFEAIARANINRSVRLDNNDLIFEGELTPENKLRRNGNGSPLVEWAPNAHGGMDIPSNVAPVGMFSAAGIRTLADTPGHPLQEAAIDAYRVLNVLSMRIGQLFLDNEASSVDLMMPNLHRDDIIQRILDARYGPRVPIFLRAPSSLVDAPYQNLASEIQIAVDGANRTTEVISTGNPRDGLLLKTTVEDREVLWRETPEGVLISVPDDMVPMQAPKRDQLLIELILEENEVTEQLNITGPKSASVKVAFVRRYLSIRNKAQLIQLLVGALASGDSSEVRNEALLSIFSNDASQESVKEKAQNYTALGKHKDRAGAVTALENALDAASTRVMEKTKVLGTMTRVEQARHERNNEAYQALAEQFAAAVRHVGESGKRYFYPANEAGISIGNRENLRARIKDFLNERVAEDLITTLDQILEEVQGLGIGFAVEVRPTSSAVDANILDIARAPYYRSPLMATMRLFEGAQRQRVSWIAFGDPTDRFRTAIQASELSAIGANPDLMRYLLVTQTTIVPTMYDRFDVLLHNLPDLAMDQLLHDRLIEARVRYAHASIKQLLAVYLLLTPISNLRAMQQLADDNVVLPIETVFWRVDSRHTMATALAMKAGIQSGVNFWSDPLVTSAYDGSRHGYQLRATLYTDATPIRVQNHVLLGPIMPRNYRGGHGAEVVENPSQIQGLPSDLLRPSVFATAVPRGHMATRLTPVSFINDLDMQFNRITRDPVTGDPARQFWTGGSFYGRYLFGGFFDPAARRAAADDDEEKYKYRNMYRRRNHLCWRGTHARIDTTEDYGSFTVINSDGARSDIRLNSVGARAYFNRTTHFIQPGTSMYEYVRSVRA